MRVCVCDLMSIPCPAFGKVDAQLCAWYKARLLGDLSACFLRGFPGGPALPYAALGSGG